MSMGKLETSRDAMRFSSVATQCSTLRPHASAARSGEIDDAESKISGMEQRLQKGMEKMEKLQQEMACSICLGDYEEGEDIRLLPCGHMFHVPCIDAWLQINRICPLCKADVNVLAADKARDRKKEKRKNFFKKLKLSGRGNAVSPRSETFADRHQELLQISDGNDKGKKKKFLMQLLSCLLTSLDNDYLLLLAMYVDLAI